MLGILFSGNVQAESKNWMQDRDEPLERTPEYRVATKFTQSKAKADSNCYDTTYNKLTNVQKLKHISVSFGVGKRQLAANPHSCQLWKSGLWQTAEKIDAMKQKGVNIPKDAVR